MISTFHFRICMVPNDADKDECVCCSEPKPGSKPKASATPAFGGSSAANPAFASVTTSGFKFAASDSNSSNTASTFRFGSGPATSNASDSSAKPTGFTFGSGPAAPTTTDSSAKPTGFTFGSTEKSTKPAEPEIKPKTSEVSETSGTSNNSEKKYSREFLSHLKALNNQVSKAKLILCQTAKSFKNGNCINFTLNSNRYSFLIFLGDGLDQKTY